jgi:hypothetical protein
LVFPSDWPNMLFPPPPNPGWPAGRFKVENMRAFGVANAGVGRGDVGAGLGMGSDKQSPTGARSCKRQPKPLIYARSSVWTRCFI